MSGRWRIRIPGGSRDGHKCSIRSYRASDDALDAWNSEGVAR